MKKGVFVFLLVVIIFSTFYLINAENNTITGSTVTGEVTNLLVLNITVSGPPQLSILHPKNHTYFSSQNLQLNFTVADEETISYSIDSAANTTITGNIKFNTTEGSHSLFLYANNTEGLTIRNVTFFVNSTQFTIKYENYFNSYKGSSTNFNSTSYEDAQNMTGVILEHTNFGKINFNNNIINLTDDENPEDNQIDLDSNTNISFNRIHINSTAIGNFNKSATLALYNLTFTNPRVLRDGSVCSSAICTEINYSGGTFNFNVTSFSTYTTEETPSEAGEEAAAPSGGGGGGGLVLPKLKKGITISDEQISVSLKQGSVFTQKITIKNDDTKKLRITIENSRLKDFLVVREPFFELNPGESMEVTLDFLARGDTKPDLYLGTLLVKTEYEEKQILVAIEVESLKSLLDARAEILGEYKEVLPGEEILAEIKLFNLGYTGRIDVLMEYIIKDYDGNEIQVEHESLAIETQANFIREISIPENAKYGNYVLYVKATYNGEVASASDGFEIVQYKVTTREKIYIMLLVVFVIIFAMFAYHLIQERTKSFKRIKKKVGIGSIIRKR
ncbi:hypothetical protein HYT25_04440 [Candidatus Pacearchaeota archaeon]|nr:hypothetical protein [Candidatus Pacearchaeota archaeon]